MIVRAGSTYRNATKGGTWRTLAVALRFSKNDVIQTRPNTIIVKPVGIVGPVEIHRAQVAAK